MSKKLLINNRFINAIGRNHNFQKFRTRKSRSLTIDITKDKPMITKLGFRLRFEISKDAEIKIAIIKYDIRKYSTGNVLGWKYLSIWTINPETIATIPAAIPCPYLISYSFDPC